MSIIDRPHMTEKAMDLMDFENKLQFIVDVDATKPEIAEAVEEAYEVEVDDVNTQITMDGEKKAIVEFAEEEAAQDLASRIGIF